MRSESRAGVAARAEAIARARACGRLLAMTMAGLAAIGLARPASSQTPSSQTLLFADFPRAEVFSDSSVRIVVSAIPPARAPDSCDLYHSPVPAGTRIETHPGKIRAAKSRTA